jgi:hypothetical protein
VVKDVAQIGEAQVVAGWSSIQEYRDWITVAVGVIVFCLREYYQYRKDRDRLGDIETNQKKVMDRFDEMARSQHELTLKLEAFIRAADKSEIRMDQRVGRIERIMDDR